MAKVSMNDLKPNSHKAKANSPIETPKKQGVKQVAAGKIRKQSVGEKFKEAFIAEDAKTVKQYVIFDVIFPGLKDLTLSILHGAVDMIFTGRTSNKKKGFYSVNHNNYGGYYGGSGSQSQAVQKSHTYENVTFTTRNEADDVLEQMKLYLDEYHRVSIATFNELAGVTGDYTDNRYGWKSLADAKVMYHQGEYFIDFPRPRDLNM